MTIKFLCPSGHELSADERLAGKPGKCPKCGIRFLIPDLAADESPDEPPAGGQAANAAPEPSPATIVFLCPNGHKLSGPRSLQGKAGQCPHCKERFLVPVIDEGVVFEAPPAEAQDESPEPDDAVDVQAIDEEVTGGSSAASLSEDDIPEGVALGPQTLPQDGTSAAGMASIFTDLWARRAVNESIEVHLEGGDAIVVERYAPHPLHANIALFASREADGRYSLTAAPWTSVRRITLRNCQQLPSELFGEAVASQQPGV